MIRQTEHELGGSVTELMAFRAFPPDEGSFDPSETTDALREFVFTNGGVRFTFEERRHWTDAGASGAGVVYVLELLGAGAVGVAMTEIYRYAKGRFKGTDDAWRGEAFRSATVEELREQMLSQAERFLDLPRGTIKPLEIDRAQDMAVLIAHNSISGCRYRVELHADDSFCLQAVDDA